MLEFLKELARRKVWLFGGIYLALGWIMLQVAIAIETTLELPGWIDQSVLVLLVIGFPFALLLAWAQESQGAARGDDDGGDEAGASDAPSPLSIAVLPFADLSPDGDQEWFSDGISEELLHRLAGEKQLTVPSRTSSFQFKGQNISIEDIGATLKIAYVLEGSVRMMENRLRITAQLIDVSTGAHKWSGTFDRELDDIFRIQDEISSSIVIELLREIGATPSETVKRYEPNLEAWQAYLRGYALSGDFSKGMGPAIVLLKQAAALDKNYFAPIQILVGLAVANQGPEGAIPREHEVNIEEIVAEGLRRSPTELEKINLEGNLASWRRDWKEIKRNSELIDLHNMGLQDTAYWNAEFQAALVCLLTGKKRQGLERMRKIVAQDAEGTGLGLPLMAAFMELHGGELKIHSTKGAGTCVSLIFGRDRSIPRSSSLPIADTA